ncbi:MAG: efflux RND transporter periplasmic adaptor subunit [Sandaracinaceae bacterium]|jgi:RND family efflux transporter MFP subunit|nr:efflux RND transporter periplasmic adaptor subunit [Sandaracinaceae bacterium]MBK8408864.1 efflux RND transporter periplasmic adaptor subunit [Sandaracinaceae bacterium]
MEEEIVIHPPAPLAKRIALLVAVLVISGLGVAMALRLQIAFAAEAERTAARDAAAADAGAAPRVAVTTPVDAEMAPLVVISGTLQPVQSADLGFEFAGRIQRVSVELGQHVDAGDALITLDRASVAAMATQTEAAIAVAEANAAMLRDRVELLGSLVAVGATPSQDLTAAERQLSVAMAQIEQARAVRRSTGVTAADHTLRAPFAGVVTRVPTGVGAVVGPGIVLVRIEDLSSLRLASTVSQADLAALRTGMTATLEARNGVVETQGTIAHLVRSLDPSTRRAPCEAMFPNADGALVANALVRARVVVGAPLPALRIPATARRPDGTVLVLDGDGRIESRLVEAQSDLDGSWLVSSGLSRSDRVMVRAAEGREGTVVVADSTPSAR